MKKLLYLFLILVLSFSLWACTSDECTEHVDENGDLLCDNCGAGIPCTAHVDENGDLKCDKCSQSVPCTNHVDEVADLLCDKCGAVLPCINHKDADKDLVCDLCEADIECTHVDNNNDGVCDITACGWNYDHTHTYSPAWSHDATNHWHAPSCSHTIELKDKGAHADANNDGVCDVCSWNYNHTHTFDTENWTADASGHWHAAACTHNVTSDKAEHNDVNGICSVCEYVICTHGEFDTAVWDSDANGHWHPAACGHDAAEVEVLPHTLDEDENCTVCGYNSGHVHTYEEEWSKDETYHWHASSCGHPTKTDGKATHKDTDENKDGVCDDCSYVYCTHTYDETTWEKDASGHWHPATCECTVTPVKIPHDDTISDGICDICSYVICSHTFNEDVWEQNATHHWHPSTCGHDAKGEYAEHLDEDNNGVCEVCKDASGGFYQFCAHFSEELTGDGAGHWYEKFCEHVTAENKKDYTEHTDNSDPDKDGMCNACKAQICNHEGNVSSEWKNDGISDNGTYHWKSATCCPSAKIDYGKHTDVDMNYSCDVCEKVWVNPNPVIPDLGEDDIIITTPPHYIGKPNN